MSKTKKSKTFIKIIYFDEGSATVFQMLAKLKSLYEKLLALP